HDAREAVGVSQIERTRDEEEQQREGHGHLDEALAAAASGHAWALRTVHGSLHVGMRIVPAVLRRKQQEKGMKATEKAGETASNLRPRAAAAGVGVIRRCWRGHRAPSDRKSTRL